MSTEFPPLNKREQNQFEEDFFDAVGHTLAEKVPPEKSAQLSENDLGRGKEQISTDTYRYSDEKKEVVPSNKNFTEDRSFVSLNSWEVKKIVEQYNEEKIASLCQLLENNPEELLFDGTFNKPINLLEAELKRIFQYKGFAGDTIEYFFKTYLDPMSTQIRELTKNKKQNANDDKEIIKEFNKEIRLQLKKFVEFASELLDVPKKFNKVSDPSQKLTPDDVAEIKKPSDENEPNISFTTPFTPPTAQTYTIDDGHCAEVGEVTTSFSVNPDDIEGEFVPLYEKLFLSDWEEITLENRMRKIDQMLGKVIALRNLVKTYLNNLGLQDKKREAQQEVSGYQASLINLTRLEKELRILKDTDASEMSLVDVEGIRASIHNHISRIREYRKNVQPYKKVARNKVANTSSETLEGYKSNYEYSKAHYIHNMRLLLEVMGAKKMFEKSVTSGRGHDIEKIRQWVDSSSEKFHEVRKNMQSAYADNQEVLAGLISDDEAIAKLEKRTLAFTSPRVLFEGKDIIDTYKAEIKEQYDALPVARRERAKRTSTFFRGCLLGAPLLLFVSNSHVDGDSQTIPIGVTNGIGSGEVSPDGFTLDPEQFNSVTKSDAVENPIDPNQFNNIPPLRFGQVDQTTNGAPAFSGPEHINTDTLPEFQLSPNGGVPEMPSNLEVQDVSETPLVVPAEPGSREHHLAQMNNSIPTFADPQSATPTPAFGDEVAPDLVAPEASSEIPPLPSEMTPPPDAENTFTPPTLPKPESFAESKLPTTLELRVIPGGTAESNISSRLMSGFEAGEFNQYFGQYGLSSQEFMRLYWVTHHQLQSQPELIRENIGLVSGDLNRIGQDSNFTFNATPIFAEMLLQLKLRHYGNNEQVTGATYRADFGENDQAVSTTTTVSADFERTAGNALTLITDEVIDSLRRGHDGGPEGYERSFSDWVATFQNGIGTEDSSWSLSRIFESDRRVNVFKIFSLFGQNEGGMTVETLNSIMSPDDESVDRTTLRDLGIFGDEAVAAAERIYKLIQEARGNRELGISDTTPIKDAMRRIFAQAELARQNN